MEDLKIIIIAFTLLGILIGFLNIIAKSEITEKEFNEYENNDIYLSDILKRGE